MTNPEFSNEFDVLYNNITSNQAPGLDEYEKSVFLTRALDDILKAYFDPRGNKFMLGYGDSTKRDIDFSMVLTTINYTNTLPTLSTIKIPVEEADRFDNFDLPPVDQGDGIHYLDKALYDLHPNSASVELPKNIMFIVNEQVLVNRKSFNKSVILLVLPLNYNEYSRIMEKPFKRPLHYLAWRISNSDASGKHKADLVVGSQDTILKYLVRYIRKPNPIILVDLGADGVSIDGETDAMECCLDPILHKEILLRAVELAKAAYIGDLNASISLGLVSGTNMGIVSQGGGNKE